MPHQCTTCDRTFPDGSKAMLGGCPDCGGNKFQFLPEGALADDEATGAPDATAGTTSASASSAPDAGGEPTHRPHGEADDDILEAPPEPWPDQARPDAEDAAQASARRSVVSRDELPTVDDRDAVLEEIARDAGPAGTGGGSPTAEGEAAAGGAAASVDDEVADRPDLAELRRELNDQFESIKILEPGQYELNLMELYDREEYIIALEEDGRYVIDVPTRWRDDEDDD